LKQNNKGTYTSPTNLSKIMGYYAGAENVITGNVQDKEEARTVITMQLELDRPVLVDVTVSFIPGFQEPAHYVIVTGFDGEYVEFNDPYTNNEGASRDKKPWKDFYNSWMKNSDFDVGGSGWWLVVSYK
jgi:uncharacterized protein YvpB